MIRLNIQNWNKLFLIISHDLLVDSSTEIQLELQHRYFVDELNYNNYLEQYDIANCLSLLQTDLQEFAELIQEYRNNESNIDYLDQILEYIDLLTLTLIEDAMINFGFNNSKDEDKNNPSQFYQSMLSSMVQNTEKWMDLQTHYYSQQTQLWMNMFARQTGQEVNPIAQPDKTDRRFASPEWSEYPFFDYLKQYYLISSQWMLDAVEGANLEDETKRKLTFYTKQYIDALSPTNFATTNPEVIKLAIETKGESLLAGLKNLLADIEKGRISMTDESVFEIGKNIATTEGAVVFENDFFQLIQYTPLTEQVNERPLLIVPPCINKYYILDLQSKNSFVRYCTEQGLTTFLISWRNVPDGLGSITWDDYLAKGVLKAIEIVQKLTGVEKLTTLGWCIGGALLSCALAVLRAKTSAEGKEFPVVSATLLTALLDYSEVGDLGIFIEEDFVAKKEQAFACKPGIVSGKELALTFSFLRANDLVWFYVVNNYLKGKTPDAFDLLYWNSDSTNLPGAMYSYYLRNFYLENNLRVPNKLTMCDVPVNLGAIDIPAYILAAREDHIVPWQTAYESTKLLSNKVEFVLAASGHIAGVINPASSNKRNFWANGVLSQSADEWLTTSESIPGSWWSHWMAWTKQKSGNLVEARQLGTADFPVIEAAPGRYVKARCA